MKRIWQQIADKSRAYFLRDSVKGPDFVVIGYWGAQQKSKAAAIGIATALFNRR